MTIPFADDEDIDDLPYPTALPRSDFLSTDFSPTAYLSSLHNRHQALEDLRSELRQRSQHLHQELLDLVNDNYQDFIGLGDGLRGGEEKVQEVTVGMLGFKREVETLREKVRGREAEMEMLMKEKGRVRKEKEMAWDLMELQKRIEELEESLLPGAEREDTDEEDAGNEYLNDDDYDDSDNDMDGNSNLAIARLEVLVQQYLLIKEMKASTGAHHPFLIKQEPRMMQIRNTLLLDLSAALKQAVHTKEQGKQMRILKIYRDMNEAAMAVQVLRTLRKR